MTDISTQPQTDTNDTPTIPNDTPDMILDLSPVTVTVTRTPCACGCGEMPQRPTARFVPGHDAKLKSMLIKAHLDGVQVIQLTDKAGTRDLSPLELATELDWDGFLLVAERKRDREVAAREARKAEKSA